MIVVSKIYLVSLDLQDLLKTINSVKKIRVLTQAPGHMANKSALKIYFCSVLRRMDAKLPAPAIQYARE